MNELRAALAAVPNRRAVLTALTEQRNDPTNPLRDVYGILVAELADIDHQEAAALRDLDTLTPWLTGE